MYRFIIVGLGAAAAAILALGCGGAGSDQATAQVSNARFMAQAKTICATTQKELAALLLVKDASSNPDRFKQSGSLLKEEARELEKIEGSKELEVKVKPLIEKISNVSVIIAREGKKGLEGPRVAAYKREAQGLNLANC